jgi:hypothetical protein
MTIARLIFSLFLHFLGAFQKCDLFQKMTFLTFSNVFFGTKTRLCREKVSGYEQELSTLFPKHPYFLLKGIKTNEWRLAC